MALLQTIVNLVNIPYMPEIIIQYLAGDCSLNHCPTTFNTIFKTIYKDKDSNTFLDPECTVLHSFNGEAASSGPYQEQQWYKNGELFRVVVDHIWGIEEQCYHKGKWITQFFTTYLKQ